MKNVIRAAISLVFALTVVLVVVQVLRPVRVIGTNVDQSQLIGICQKRTVGGMVDKLAIDTTDTYALVHCHGTYAGGSFLAKKVNGIWQVTFGSGGVVGAGDLVRHGLDSTTANYLASNEVPPTPSATPTPSTTATPSGGGGGGGNHCPKTCFSPTKPSPTPTP